MCSSIATDSCPQHHPEASTGLTTSALTVCKTERYMLVYKFSELRLLSQLTLYLQRRTTSFIVQQCIIQLGREVYRTGGEGGKTEKVWLLIITTLPAAAYNSSLNPLSPLPSLLTTHPTPYLPTAAPQSPPFSNPNHSPAVPLGSPSTSSNPISNLKPLSLPCSTLTPVNF